MKKGGDDNDGTSRSSPAAVREPTTKEMMIVTTVFACGILAGSYFFFGMALDSVKHFDCTHLKDPSLAPSCENTKTSMIELGKWVQPSILVLVPIASFVLVGLPMLRGKYGGRKNERREEREGQDDYESGGRT